MNDAAGLVQRTPRAAEGEALIAIRRVAKGYTRGEQWVPVLTDINLDIGRGDFVALMGPSGSGKSTLLNLVAGIDKPDTGSIIIAGEDITQLSETELAGWRAASVGFIFQFYNLMPVLSAWENVELPLLLTALSRRERAQRVETVLSLVGLADRMDHRPNELSGGQQQRVAIARALANNPAILLCDEPTANLDLHTGQEIMDILRRLNADRGVTIICATHDHRMLDICDRLMWIRDGLSERVARREDVHIEVGSIGGRGGH